MVSNFFRENPRVIIVFGMEVETQRANRNSRRKCTVKTVFWKMSQFSHENICWSLFLVKLQACNFLKKRLQHMHFPVKFAKFLKTPFFIEHLWRTASQIRIFTSLFWTIFVSFGGFFYLYFKKTNDVSIYKITSGVFWLGIGCLRITWSYVDIGLVLLPIWRLGVILTQPEITSKKFSLRAIKLK